MERPLLPYLTFKVRPGDSLVQEVGGVNFSLHSKITSISPALKGRITKLKGEKLHFYQNDGKGTLRTEAQLRQEETRLFHDILMERRLQLQHEIQRIAKEKLGHGQQTLDGDVEHALSQQERSAAEERQRQLEEELDSITSAEQALAMSESVPFVWDIAFVEVFGSEKEGFDIVIGNPPYVRSGKIKDPAGLCEKTLYKAKLRRSAYSAYPWFFGYKQQKDTQPNNPERAVSHALDGNSDLYTFFYFHGLSLLNERGSFCFITSNSWLDVDYGAELQEFLLKQSHVRLIMDNLTKRSFRDADINTIIALLAPPCTNRDCGLSNTARFAMFKVPFEDVMSPILFEEIDEANERLIRPEFRAIPILQADLLAEGMKAEDGEGTPARTSRRQKYTGGKWGGKYLRAPDVYWKIIERAGDRLVRLGDIADIQRGFTTGANDFFYVRVLEENNGIARILCDDGSEHLIESEYVQEPVLVKAREIVRPRLREEDLKYRLVRLDEKAANRKYAKEYIAWGESLGFHERPTTRSRRPWFAIRVQNYADIAFPMAHKRRPVLADLSAADIHIDNRFYGIYPVDKLYLVLTVASLLSTFGTLCREIQGRANFGQGMLDMKVYEAADLPILSPASIRECRKLQEAYDALASRNIFMLYDDVRCPDRAALDDAFLFAAGFDDSTERSSVLAELQDAACRMVWMRQAKAGNTREARQTYDEWLSTGEPFGQVDEE